MYTVHLLTGPSGTFKLQDPLSYGGGNAVHTTFVRGSLFSYGQKNSGAVDIWNTPWKLLTTARFSNRLLNEYCAGSPPDLRKATLPGRAFFVRLREAMGIATAAVD